jgi:hypothetical protein
MSCQDISINSRLNRRDIFSLPTNYRKKTRYESLRNSPFSTMYIFLKEIESPSASPFLADLSNLPFHVIG